MSPFWLFCVTALFLYANGEDCPKDPQLKKIIAKHTKVVPLKSMDGTWMVVQAPEAEMKDVKASYSGFDVNEPKTELDISVHDYMKSGNHNMYFQSMKIKPGTENKVISWTGGSAGDKPTNKDVMVFYIDPKVLAYYSCDPSVTVDQGWTVRILVNAANRKDLLDNEEHTTKSLKAAVDQLKAIQAENDKWKSSHEGKFGLLGPVTQMNFQDLEPENYNPDEEDGTIM